MTTLSFQPIEVFKPVKLSICPLRQYEAVLYKSYQAAVKRASPLQTAQTETHRGQAAPKMVTEAKDSVNVGKNVLILMAILAERASCGVEDFPDEPPPDFIPPPPPRSAAV